MKFKRAMCVFAVLAILLVGSKSAFAAIASFSDVDSTDWFYPSVMTLAQKGIITGYSDGTFKPQNSITQAEALKLIMGAAEKEPYVKTDTEPWYSGYMLKAADLGIISSKKPFDASAYVTRQVVAEMLILSLGVSLKPEATGYFADTNNLYAETLKDLGIVEGSTNSKGQLVFSPAANISRAEISALIIRSNTYYKTNIKDTSLSNPSTDTILVDPMKASERIIVAEPRSQAEYENVLRYMVYNKKFTYSITYRDLLKTEAFDNCKAAFHKMSDTCPEYFAIFNSLDCMIKSTNSEAILTIKLSNRYYEEGTLLGKHTAYITSVEAALKEMIAAEQLKKGMSQKDMALAIYKWICLNAEYGDTINNVVDYDSYNGYGYMHNKTAVCQGYTAVYNLMCKYVGITSQGIAGQGGISQNGSGHIWTGQILDGVRVMTDATWGDQGGIYWNTDWFAGSAAEFDEEHDWDKEDFAQWSNAPGL